MDNSNPCDDQPDERGGQLELPDANASSSPFDALRQEDERGEFWSARDVMPHLDYEQWRRFVDSIERAMAACRNSGDRVEDHFAASGKITINARGHKRVLDDYRLSRHGAYLVAINGDSRKDAIAKAQTYFAQQTRKQELAEQAAVEVPAPRRELSNRELAMMVIEEADRADRAEALAASATAKVAELTPGSELAETYAAANGTMTIRTFARTVQQWAQTRGIKVLQEHVFDYLGIIGMVIRAKTSEKGQATATALKAGWCENSTKDYDTYTRGTLLTTYARLTPRGVDHAWKRIHEAIGKFGTLDPKVIRP